MQMIKKLFSILLLYSLTMFSQNEQLRIEMIDVFKEYVPEITNSSKISEQPTFIDTLKANIIHNKSILKKNLVFKESRPIIYSNHFSFIKSKLDYQKYASLHIGSQYFLNTKFHYTSGLSTRHNSGIYLEHVSEAYLINKDLDGEQFTSLQAYSNYFLNETLLSAVFNFNNRSGFYWADLEPYSPDAVKKYGGTNFDIQLDLYDQSNTRLLHHADVGLNYFSNNYGRNEFFCNPSVDLSVEQALKKYVFNLDFQVTHTTFNRDTDLIAYQVGDNQFSSVHDLTGFSDILIGSKLLIGGNKTLDYNIGLNFQYSPNESIQYADMPLLFPDIHFSYEIKNTQKLEFKLTKELSYHPFNQVFNSIPYLDPYYRNSLSKQFKITCSYMRKLHQDISLASNLHYIRERGSLIPFVFSQNIKDNLSNLFMRPLGVYLDSVQQGLQFSSSLSFDKSIYNILIDGTLSLVESKRYADKQFVPKFSVNSIITLNITNRFNVISNWSFVGKRDVIQIKSMDYANKVISYSILDSYLQTDFSLNYNLGAKIFSLDLQNIFGQDIDFFDGYYDDDGLKIYLGFAYKF